MIQSTFVLALAGLSTFADAAPHLIKRGSSKRGYAFGKNNQGLINLFTPVDGCWGYNWEAKVAQPGNSVVYKLDSCEYVPMLHDDGDVFAPVWAQDAEAAIAQGSKHVLSFNEPDHCGPSGEGGTCMDVTRAVNKHKELIGPIAEKHKDVLIGSVAVTNGNEANKGLNYLTQFLAACTGCRIDFVAVHWQWNGEGGSVEKFQEHVTSAHEQTGKPVWVTEYQAPVPGNADDFIKRATEWMDKQEFVHRYAYYSVDAKLTANGALTTLGSGYVSA